MRYTEIDVSLYDNPRLKSYKEEDDDDDVGNRVPGQGVGQGEEPETQQHRHRNLKSKPKRNLPHEELLLFVGKEWKDLAVEVRNYGRLSIPF